MNIKKKKENLQMWCAWPTSWAHCGFTAVDRMINLKGVMNGWDTFTIWHTLNSNSYKKDELLYFKKN